MEQTRSAPSFLFQIREMITSTIPCQCALYSLQAETRLGPGAGHELLDCTDLFEEPGPATAPFQGGLGLISPQGIRKPAYFAYKYSHALQGNATTTSDQQAMLSE